MSEGRRVSTLKRLDQLGRTGRAVYVSLWKRHSSAAWMMSMQARALLRFLEAGVYEYKRASK